MPVAKGLRTRYNFKKSFKKEKIKDFKKMWLEHERTSLGRNRMFLITKLQFTVRVNHQKSSIVGIVI